TYSGRRWPASTQSFCTDPTALDRAKMADDIQCLTPALAAVLCGFPTPQTRLRGRGAEGNRNADEEPVAVAKPTQQRGAVLLGRGFFSPDTGHGPIVAVHR